MKSILERHLPGYSLTQVPSCQPSHWEHKPRGALAGMHLQNSYFQREHMGALSESLPCDKFIIVPIHLFLATQTPEWWQKGKVV